MKLKRYFLPMAVAAVVLALLAGAAWHHDHPQWHSMPKSLATPPNVDRSRIPLGPYTADFSGLIGGRTGDNMVTFYVVMRPNYVHLQRVGEVGKALDGASVTGLSISYPVQQRERDDFPVSEHTIDGLRLEPGSLATYPKFEIPLAKGKSERKIRITCSLGEAERATLKETHSFQGVKHGSCGAHFFPRSNLYGYLRAIPPVMLAEMSSFLPELFKNVSKHIEGGP